MRTLTTSLTVSRRSNKTIPATIPEAFSLHNGRNVTTKDSLKDVPQNIEL